LVRYKWKVSGKKAVSQDYEVRRGFVQKKKGEGKDSLRRETKMQLGRGKNDAGKGGECGGRERALTGLGRLIQGELETVAQAFAFEKQTQKKKAG